MRNSTTQAGPAGIRFEALARIALLGIFACVLAIPAGARTVRVFAVNPRVDLSYAGSYADYRDKMAALFDATHPRRHELVQEDVDDVASQLRPRDPLAPEDVLVVFPEDVGLVAGLIGSRGATARELTAQEGSTLAFVALGLSYQSQIRYYTRTYAKLRGLRSLFLALTDTLYRAFYETFRQLAQTHGVYVAASMNASPAERIDAAQDPDLVALLRDPDEAGTRDYAYLATSPFVVNTLFVFTPGGEILTLDRHGRTIRSPSETDGILLGSLDKAYLTEIEQDPLGLAPGRVQALDVLDTPIGRIGSVTSKDAWMIDVNDRYDAKGVEILVQAEAFDSWAFIAEPWSPDNFKAGGFAQTQRNPGIRYNVTSCLVGNLFEITFDGQGAILGKRHKEPPPLRTSRTAWIGQNADSGFLKIAPWIVEDPGMTASNLTLAVRRSTLAAQGSRLLPLSGVPCSAPNRSEACENGYRESVIFADLDLPDPQQKATREPRLAEPTAFGPSRSVDPSAASEQRHPSIAAHGGTVYVAWQDARAGFENIYLAVSTDRGQNFTAQRVSDSPQAATAELRPDVAVSPDGGLVFVTWQEFCSGRNDDCGRVRMARFDASGTKLGPDVRVDSDAEGLGKWNPAIAVARRNNPVIAWVDERDRTGDGLAFEHIYLATSRDQGRSFGPSVRVDRGAPTRFAAELDHKWAPSIAAARGWIHVSWTDFRNYNWDIYAARSRNGLRFKTNRRVDDAVGLERLHDHPSLAIDERGVVHAVWADRRGRDPDTNVRYASGRGGRFGRSFPVHSSGNDFDPDSDTPSHQWHPEIASDRNDLFVVWQDDRLGDNDIFFAHSRDRGATFDPEERADDSGHDSSGQYRPDVAVDTADPTDRSIYVAWEDERSGLSSIRVVRRTIPPAND